MPSVETVIKPKTNLKEPPMFEVIYMNDNKTTVSFVIESLVKFFDYDEQAGAMIANKVHVEGQAIVATLPYEIAEQKCIDVIVAARAEGFPFQVKIEKAKG